jgi:pimeloyl-ACP methyl ester carboxylesterase/ribosomal protein S18 acetylase RimI-like enzyme
MPVETEGTDPDGRKLYVSRRRGRCPRDFRTDARWWRRRRCVRGRVAPRRYPPPATTTQATLTSLTLRGGQLELLDISGDPRKTPLLLLHEGLGSVGLWRGFPDRLAEATGHRTIAFSRYGHGQSDRPATPRTPSFMHEEALEVLPELLAQLHIERPILVGHSDGASIALIHAAHHPVEAVVAIAPHVFVEDICLREIQRAKTAYEETDLRDKLARHHRDPDAAFFGWNDVWLDPAFPQWDITDELERITCPLLLIQGERDQYGTLAQLDAIERRAKGRVTRLHLDCQHSPPTEAPQETAGAIATFVHGLDIEIREERFDAPVSAALVADYVAEIRAMYPEWSPNVPPQMDADDVEPPHGRWLVAYRGGRAVGCAGLKRLDERTAEIKRIYVAPTARGAGVARALIDGLEAAARDAGYETVRLDTGAKQPASVALFRSAGYTLIADYNGNPVAAYWFEKRLA